MTIAESLRVEPAGRATPLKEVQPDRLAYLDGLRAMASLYVVVFHAVIGFPRGELSGAWRLLRRLSAFGHEAVAVFIVLSGYCLMLPALRDGTYRLPRSLGSFVGRRAFRILPPYYATLGISLLLLWSLPLLRERTGTSWDDSLPGLAWPPVLAHLLLVHNWLPDLAVQINGPLWSVATEWQIYFFFPLLLLPLWRRLGPLPTLAIATLVGYAPWLFLREAANVAIPWYLGLFAFGMFAAAINRSPHPRERALLDRIAWDRLTTGLWVAVAIGGIPFGALWFQFKPLTDLLVGIASASMLVHITRAADRGEPSRLLAWFNTRPALQLGHFSYSLYLTHLPVLALCFHLLDRWALSPHVHSLLMVAFGMPASLLFAYAFYWLVERHCLTQPAALRRLLS
ncbi:MAG: acyltransferase [Myxococcales bacterium]